ncbi:hypothetical protein A1A1_14684 [Planococcus antarcticus DSM 14505]|uniref:Ferric siderophore reductase C-terminal domain-containing protein n=1 Tax=Planococcus antarcticus DSM 14505 TaxID=1185653 RepID=A0A1C7DES5_9BACL|nr:hypothetical protein [Planococcus antarcticus]ANU09917.1 hypothetical protein BBH88_06195 [Planococcus antarcticus DSM 14505]EIM05739.1 hypothetical protein A1A1_14684 [Planococcus antarcticus DSM 14505]
MTFPQSARYLLSSQSVAVDRTPQQPLSQDIPTMIEELKCWCGTDNAGVAVSYFFRQYALYVTAQFTLLHQHGGYFSIHWWELQFDRVRNYGLPLLETYVKSSTFKHIQPSERSQAFHEVLYQQVDELLNEFKKHIKISSITCWENVLGSVIWFYASLETRSPRTVAEDMEWLLDEANWLPIKTSYLSKLLDNTSLQQAVSKPLRKTCCLYKEMPSFSTCTFCPKPN